jgi:peptidoglycan/xylan/chitin deacetylase (PgdA/CDA1 family)
MMKTLRPFFLPITLLVMMTGCAQPKPHLELVTDQYGVTYQINPQEKSVYLVYTGHFSTNDNGYFENFDGADDVLKTMAEHHVKGSFFPTGLCFRVERYQQVIRDIIAQGHYLSSHSYRHLLLCAYEDRNQSLVTLDSLALDTAEMESVLEAFGLAKEEYVWLIPPYEYYNQFSADAYRALGYKLANPTRGLVTSMDWMGPNHPQYHSAEQLVNNIWEFEKEHTLNGAIILIHAMDYPDRTDDDRPYKHLGTIIERLKSLGYSFKTFKDVIAAEQ